MKETTVIYLRLSKEDEFIRDESNSIANQRLLLRKYIAENSTLNSSEIIEIKDDGYSGKNMERPGMNRLLDMVRRRQVNNIVVKDFSRFSREHMELGKYVEQIFPMMEIRFISVNDDYDSRDYVGGIGGIDIITKAILYDFYSEDLSVKVKSALKSKRDGGRYIAAFAPYGYRKKGDDKYSLEVDPYAANIVRRIFSDYLSGKTMYRIAKELNGENELSPAEYIFKRDNTVYNKAWLGSKWSTTSLSRILHNEEYAGMIVYNKQADSEVAKKATTLRPRDEWSRIEDAHEAIIDEDTFEKVQDKVKHNVKRASVNDPSIFTGKIICRGCGHIMAISYKGKTKFQCSHKYRLADKTEFSKCALSVREEDLYSIVIRCMKGKLGKLEKRQELAEAAGAGKHRRELEARGRLKQMEETIGRLKQDQLRAYEAYRDGSTDRDTFMMQRQTSEEMISRLEDNIAKQETAICRIAEESSTLSWLADIDELSEETLSRELLDALVDRIMIGPQRNIEIIWKFN